MLEIQENMRQADRECDIQCNLVWDGFGRWVTGYKWLPYMNFTGEGKQHNATENSSKKEKKL